MQNGRSMWMDSRRLSDAQLLTDVHGRAQVGPWMPTGMTVGDRGHMPVCMPVNMSVGISVDSHGHSIPTPLGLFSDPTHPTPTLTPTLTDDRPPIRGVLVKI